MKPATLLQKITLPQPFSSIAGIHNWVRRKAVPQFVRHVFSKSSMVMSEMDLTPDFPREEPALLKRIVGWPRVDVTAAWRW